MYNKKYSIRDEVPEEIHNFGGNIANSLIRDYKKKAKKSRRMRLDFEDDYKNKHKKRFIED